MRKPELELEQAVDGMAEVARMVVVNDLADVDLLATVADTRHGLDEAQERVSLSRHRSTTSLLDDCC